LRGGQREPLDFRFLLLMYTKRGENVAMIWNTRLRAGVASLVLLGVATAAQGQSREDGVPKDFEQAVKARLAEIQDAAETLDAEKVFSFVLENNKGALVEDGKLHQTREAALQSTKRGFRHLSKISYQFEQQHITLLSPTVALVTGEGVSSATTVNGKTISSRFAQSVVLALTDGEWKVLHAHRSFPRSK
jgi:uncharacterized protein (TIGR02246 family)